MVYFVTMRAIFFSFLYLLVLVSISKYIFDPAHLYYVLWWLDIPMHFFGGIGVGLLTFATLRFSKQKITFHKVVIIYLAFALTWELYEYVTDVIYGTEINTLIDSIKDILVGLVGAAGVYYIQRK